MQLAKTSNHLTFLTKCKTQDCISFTSILIACSILPFNECCITRLTPHVIEILSTHKPYYKYA
jgi:hypothetical protein